MAGNADLHRERQPAIKVHGFHGKSLRTISLDHIVFELKILLLILSLEKLLFSSLKYFIVDFNPILSRASILYALFSLFFQTSLKIIATIFLEEFQSQPLWKISTFEAYTRGV